MGAWRGNQVSQALDGSSASASGEKSRLKAGRSDSWPCECQFFHPIIIDVEPEVRSDEYRYEVDKREERLGGVVSRIYACSPVAGRAVLAGYRC